MKKKGRGNTNSTKINELRQQVESLNARISKLEKANLNSKKDEKFSENATKVFKENNETSIIESNSQTFEYLDNEVNSNNPDNWLEVANSFFANEKYCLLVAEKCTNIDYYYFSYQDKEATINIAKALSENPNSTNKVMKELTNSKYPDVWLIVANSKQSKEETLKLVAEKCANIDYYCFSYQDKDAAINIAKALSENPNSTDEVMKELTNSKFPDVWLIVANSKQSKEEALKSVAEKCANIDYYCFSYQDKDAAINIANALSENPNSTNSIMSKLTTSKFSSVVSIAHQWIEK